MDIWIPVLKADIVSVAFNETNGYLYVTNWTDSSIDRISEEGRPERFCGSSTKGYLDGTASLAKFIQPRGLAFDNKENIIVGDTTCIRRISKDGFVATIAGSGVTMLFGSYQ